VQQTDDVVPRRRLSGACGAGSTALMMSGKGPAFRSAGHARDAPGATDGERLFGRQRRVDELVVECDQRQIEAMAVAPLHMTTSSPSTPL
jgi:hypothetical protein